MDRPAGQSHSRAAREPEEPRRAEAPPLPARRQPGAAEQPARHRLRHQARQGQRPLLRPLPVGPAPAAKPQEGLSRPHRARQAGPAPAVRPHLQAAVPWRTPAWTAQTAVQTEARRPVEAEAQPRVEVELAVSWQAGGQAAPGGSPALPMPARCPCPTAELDGPGSKSKAISSIGASVCSSTSAFSRTQDPGRRPISPSTNSTPPISTAISGQLRLQVRR